MDGMDNVSTPEGGPALPPIPFTPDNANENSIDVFGVLPDTIYVNSKEKREADIVNIDTVNIDSDLFDIEHEQPTRENQLTLGHDLCNRIYNTSNMTHKDYSELIIDQIQLIINGNSAEIKDSGDGEEGDNKKEVEEGIENKEEVVDADNMEVNDSEGYLEQEVEALTGDMQAEEQ
eukprot:Ihof_evm2s524 gene=Ihof_evmTU2s524